MVVIRFRTRGSSLSDMSAGLGEMIRILKICILGLTYFVSRDYYVVRANWYSPETKMKQSN